MSHSCLCLVSGCKWLFGMKSKIVKLSPKGWLSFKTLKVTDVTKNDSGDWMKKKQVLFFITLETKEF